MCFIMAIALNSLLEWFTIYFHWLPYVLRNKYHTFLKVLNRLQRTTVISSLPYMLLYALPYIFSKIRTYLYLFQRITPRYRQIFKKEL